MAIVLFFVLHWYLSLFFQSFFHHRYAAHRQFTMSKPAEKICFVFSFLTQGSSYISPYTYGVMHRLHHMHTDESGDPHSPENHSGFLQMMWQTRNAYRNLYVGKTPFDDKLACSLPVWRSFDKIAHSGISRLMWIGIYATVYAWLVTAPWQWILFPFTVFIGSVQGAFVNWWAHTFGYRNFETTDRSRNFLPVDVIFLGEAYHNNHHQYPGRVNYACKWFEIDPGYYVILLLHKLRFIRLRSVI